eukprot:5663091-Prymnesium_polylepis.1
MHKSCQKSCGRCGVPARQLPPPTPPQPQREAWELEVLEQPYRGSAVSDVSGAQLSALAAESPLLFTWFYAPWCKQCKLVRLAVEQAAKNASAGVRWARLDCTADANAKQHYEVFSYPSFKAVRGKRHRWVEVPRNRTTEVLSALAEREAGGAYLVARTAEELRAAIHEPAPAG